MYIVSDLNYLVIAKCKEECLSAINFYKIYNELFWEYQVIKEMNRGPRLIFFIKISESYSDESETRLAAVERLKSKGKNTPSFIEYYKIVEDILSKCKTKKDRKCPIITLNKKETLALNTLNRKLPKLIEKTERLIEKEKAKRNKKIGALSISEPENSEGEISLI